MGKEPVSYTHLDLSNEMDFKVVFNESLEKEISARLDKAGIPVKKVSVAENQKTGFEVYITHSQCCGKKQCTMDIIPIVSRALGRKMRREKGNCNIMAVSYTHLFHRPFLL